jgi:hypothetical protein
MKKLTPKEKKALIAKFFKLSVLLGYSLEPYMGMSLSSFNFDLVEAQIKRLNEMYENPGNRYYE